MPFLAQADRRDAMSEFVKPITLASMRANASWMCAILPTPDDGDGAPFHASEDTRPLVASGICMRADAGLSQRKLLSIDRLAARRPALGGDEPKPERSRASFMVHALNVAC